MMRSTRSIEILLFWRSLPWSSFWSGALTAQIWPVIGLLRSIRACHRWISRPPLPARPQPHQAADRILVDDDIHHLRAVVYGQGGSPLFNLYAAAIILSALTLGRVVTLLQVAAIAICHLLATVRVEAATL